MIKDNIIHNQNIKKMMSNIKPDKELIIENFNNKLSNKYFLQIHFSPPKGKIIEADFDKIYLVKSGEITVYAKLIEFNRIKLGNISSFITYVSEGIDLFEFCKKFMDKYPTITYETEMAIYCYERID